MPFVTRLNKAGSISKSDAVQLIEEMLLLRAELNDMRAKFLAMRGLLMAESGSALAVNDGVDTLLSDMLFVPFDL